MLKCSRGAPNMISWPPSYEQKKHPEHSVSFFSRNPPSGLFLSFSLLFSTVASATVGLLFIYSFSFKEFSVSPGVKLLIFFRTCSLNNVFPEGCNVLVCMAGAHFRTRVQIEIRTLNHPNHPQAMHHLFNNASLSSGRAIISPSGRTHRVWTTSDTNRSWMCLLFIPPWIQVSARTLANPALLLIDHYDFLLFSLNHSKNQISIIRTRSVFMYAECSGMTYYAFSASRHWSASMCEDCCTSFLRWALSWGLWMSCSNYRSSYLHIGWKTKGYDVQILGLFSFFFTSDKSDCHLDKEIVCYSYFKLHWWGESFFFMCNLVKSFHTPLIDRQNWVPEPIGEGALIGQPWAGNGLKCKWCRTEAGGINYNRCSDWAFLTLMAGRWQIILKSLLLKGPRQRIYTWVVYH